MRRRSARRPSRRRTESCRSPSRCHRLHKCGGSPARARHRAPARFLPLLLLLLLLLPPFPGLLLLLLTSPSPVACLPPRELSQQTHQHYRRDVPRQGHPRPDAPRRVGGARLRPISTSRCDFGGFFTTRKGLAQPDLQLRFVAGLRAPRPMAFPATATSARQARRRVASHSVRRDPPKGARRGEAGLLRILPSLR